MTPERRREIEALLTVPIEGAARMVPPLRAAILELLAALPEWEPDAATVEEMAKAMHDDYPHPQRQEDWEEMCEIGRDYWRRKARAAYRAAVKGGR